MSLLDQMANLAWVHFGLRGVVRNLPEGEGIGQEAVEAA